jgi:hypothetical protein
MRRVGLLYFLVVVATHVSPVAAGAQQIVVRCTNNYGITGTVQQPTFDFTVRWGASTTCIGALPITVTGHAKLYEAYPVDVWADAGPLVGVNFVGFSQTSNHVPSGAYTTEYTYEHLGPPNLRWLIAPPTCEGLGTNYIRCVGVRTQAVGDSTVAASADDTPQTEIEGVLVE